MYDFLIVGAGLFGSVFAEQCIKNKKTVLVIDKRNHIAGNCFTEKYKDIDVHKYGPHIFHTNNDLIWQYVNNFTTFNNFTLRTKVNYNNRIYSFPINLMTMHQLWGVLTPKEAKEKLNSVKINIKNPNNLEEWILSQVGEEIYYKFIYGYTKKQWQIEPKLLPKFIIQRLPIRINFDDNYFNDKYQGIPQNGYTEMINNMLYGADIALVEDYISNRDYWDKKAKQIIFTGRIDEYYHHIYGSLNYRTLKFEQELHDIEDYQGNAIINYTEYNLPYTRIVEHKHFKNILCDYTIITKEYPDTWKEDSTPYYPINTEKNNKIYNKYKKIKSKTIFGGRLAEYKYYDMHQIIGSSLSLSKHILK
jgi:UDP-galactopyranose mutase